MAGMPLYLKHRLATSAAAGPVAGLRNILRCGAGRAHPELSLLHAEDAIMAQKLEKIVKPGMSCLDIGAHIGSVAYRLEELAGKGRVKLIEAVPEKAEWLKGRFGAAQVTSCAITERGDDAVFYVDNDRPGFSGLSKREGTREIRVPAMQLDALYATDTFDFIKIDVEGHELPALRSGQRLLERSRAVILFEAGPVDGQVATASDDLFDWLTGTLDYDVFAVFEVFHRDAPLDMAAFRLYRAYPFIAFNYFAIPKMGTERQ